MVLIQTDIGLAGAPLPAGFPPASNWEGVGVFSHSCKLSHPLRQGRGVIENNVSNGARRTFREDAHIVARTGFVVAKPSYEHLPSAQMCFFVRSTSVESLFSMTLLQDGEDGEVIQWEDFQAGDLPISVIGRPEYRRGREVMVYMDATHIHSAPDETNRESVWRFM